MKKPLPLLIAAGALALLGLIALGTPVRFTGALLIAAGGALLLWALIRTHKVLRRIFVVLLVLGFSLFAVAETLVVHYALRTDDRPASAVIVLGAGVYGTRPSLSLRVRLESALDYAQAHPEIPVVVSGGKGSGEDITEAECMYRWLTEQGLEPERILREPEAVNTIENLDFSCRLLRQHGIDTTDNIAVVSSDYHLYRASLYWGAPNMVPVPADMPAAYWPVTVNQFIREAFGVVEYWAFRS